MQVEICCTGFLQTPAKCWGSWGPTLSNKKKFLRRKGVLMGETRVPAPRRGWISPYGRWWAGKDSNLRRRKPPDLQSGAFDHFATDPIVNDREYTGSTTAELLAPYRCESQRASGTGADSSATAILRLFRLSFNVVTGLAAVKDFGPHRQIRSAVQ